MSDLDLGLLSRFIQGKTLIDKGMLVSELVEHVRTGALVPYDDKQQPLVAPHLESLLGCFAYYSRKKRAMTETNVHCLELKEIDLYLNKANNDINEISDNQWKTIAIVGNSTFDKPMIDTLVSAFYLRDDIERTRQYLAEKGSLLSSTSPSMKSEAKTKRPNVKAKWDVADPIARELKKKKFTWPKVVDDERFKAAFDGNPPTVDHVTRVFSRRWREGKN